MIAAIGARGRQLGTGIAVRPTLFTWASLRRSGSELVKGGRCLSGFSHHPFALSAGGGCCRIWADRVLQSGVSYDHQTEGL